MLTLPIFLIAFFAIIVAMHRGVTRKADTKLRSMRKAWAVRCRAN